MTARDRAAPRFERGFTLIETVIVLLVLAVAGTAIVALQEKLFTGQATVKNMQVSSRLLMECAEQVLAVRRYAEGGYDLVTTANSFGAGQCGNVPALGSNAIPTVVLTDSYSGPACPTNFNCKLATITQGGLASVTVMLVDY
jgi:prepilin-type N-terminal cleavage/methylation domain-containing protein